MNLADFDWLGSGPLPFDPMNPRYEFPASVLYDRMVQAHIREDRCKREHDTWQSLPFASGSNPDVSQLAHIAMFAFLEGTATEAELYLYTGFEERRARHAIARALRLIDAGEISMRVSEEARAFGRAASESPPPAPRVQFMPVAAGKVSPGSLPPFLQQLITDKPPEGEKPDDA